MKRLIAATCLASLAVATLVATSSAAAVPVFQGTVGPGFTIKLAKKPTKAGKVKIVVADRYAASSLAYGEAEGLDVAWLVDAQRRLPPADLTLVLDIAPETSLARKRASRDRFERDLPLLSRVRDSYRRQAGAAAWRLLDGAQSPDLVRSAVIAAVRSVLAPQ